MAVVCINGVVRLPESEIDRLFVAHKTTSFLDTYSQHLEKAFREKANDVRQEYSSAALIGGGIGGAIAAVGAEKSCVPGLIASAISTAGSVTYIDNLTDGEAIGLEHSLSKIEIGGIAGIGSLAAGALANYLFK